MDRFNIQEHTCIHIEDMQVNCFYKIKINAPDLEGECYDIDQSKTFISLCFPRENGVELQVNGISVRRVGVFVIWDVIA